MNNHRLNCLLCQQKVSRKITDEQTVKEYYSICIDCLNKGTLLTEEKLDKIQKVWEGIGFLLANPQKSNNEWFVLKALSIMIKNKSIELEKSKNDGRIWLIVDDERKHYIVLGDNIKDSVLWEEDE